jgi:hypothetical protein
MNNKIRLITSISIFLLVFTMATGIASAKVVATITIYDETGTQTVEFPVGEVVGISWTANGPIDISVVYDVTNNVVLFIDNAPTPGSTTYIPQSGGDYSVYVYGHGTATVRGYGSFFAAPESAFGALAALGACFVGFMIFKKRSSLPTLRLN